MSNRQESLRIERAAEKFRSTIPDRAERMVRVFLEREEIFPGATILDGKRSFTITSNEGKEETYVPDIDIIRKDGRFIYIEVTRDSRNGTDPKERDRRIMKKAAPDSLFVVIYNTALKAIQRKYPAYNFFKSEKKRKKDRESSPKMKPRFVRVNFMTSSINQ